MLKMGSIVTALFVVGVTGWFSSARAATVDGQVTASDGYTEVFSVTWTISGMMGENLGTIVGGTLWQQRNADGKLTNFAIRLPKGYVDNSYGVNTVGTYGGMGGGTHTFDDLLGSDHVVFDIVDMNDNVVLEFTADYIAAILNSASSGMDGMDGMDGMGGTTTADAYKSAGVLNNGEDHPTGGVIDDKADGDKVAATSTLAMQVPLVASSLEHNLAVYGFNAGGLDLLQDSPPVLVDINNEPILDAFGNYQIDGDAATKAFWANWEFAVIYEVQIDPSKFTGGMPINALPVDSHASPAKTEGSLTDPIPTPIPTTVPEPTSLALLGLSAWALPRRRRARRAA